MKKIVTFLFAFVFISIFSVNTVRAAVTETEPNNSTQQATEISLNTEYSGCVFDADDIDDEDFYKVYMEENSFYKISIYNLKDNAEYGWKTLIVSYLNNSNSESSDGSDIDIPDNYGNSTVLVKADYSGYHYIAFWNTQNTSYSFKVEKYSPKGKIYFDNDSNKYKFLNNNELEFCKVASKRKTSFSFPYSLNISRIDNMEVLDYSDDEYGIVSIGKYAFKGSSIKNIYIDESIKKIGVGAFQNCKKLGTRKYMMGVVISGKRVVIEKNAFAGCKKLGSIRIVKGASVKSVGKNALKNTKKNIRIEVPSVKKYQKMFKKSGAKRAVFSKTYI